MALTVITDEMRRKAPNKRITFVRNTCEGGVDYGPDYEQDTVEVPLHRATHYINQGRAVEAPAEAPADERAVEAPAEEPAAPAPLPKRQRG